METANIKPDLEVRTKNHSASGIEDSIVVGSVDHLDGPDYIKLKKRDAFDGEHHWVPVNLVNKVTNEAVYLDCTEEEFLSNLLNDKPLN